MQTSTKICICITSTKSSVEAQGKYLFLLASMAMLKQGGAFRSLKISVIISGAIIFVVVAVDFILALEILIATLESENTSGSSTFKQSFELQK